MARLVALWRCKCGTRVKVVAEACSSPSGQMASCPKCRDPHVIHADKIISVTEDTERTPDNSPAADSCEEKQRLLIGQSKAFDIYCRGASELAQAAGTMVHAEFEFLAKRVSAARQFWMETRKQLNEHTAKHGC
jgi:hypothetical protein